MSLDQLPSVFSRAEGNSLGLSDANLKTLVKRGSLTRLRHGVLAKVVAAPGELAGHEVRDREYLTRIRAAAKAFTAGYAVSHLSAAALHGLDLPLGPLGEPHLTAIYAVQRSKRATGAIVHHCDSTLTGTQVVDELLATSVPRTVVDCLRHFSPLVAVPIADSAIRNHGITIEDIELELSRQRRWVGRPKARQGLELVDGRRETWLESYSFVTLHRGGQDLPTPQVELFDERGDFVARVDGMWIEDGVVGEADGKLKYEPLPGETVEAARTRVLYGEKVREDSIRRLSLGCVRWGLGELRSDPIAVNARITAARCSGSISRFRGTYRIPDPTGRSKSEV